MLGDKRKFLKSNPTAKKGVGNLYGNNFWQMHSFLLEPV